jgi:hypothetical protein
MKTLISGMLGFLAFAVVLLAQPWLGLKRTITTLTTKKVLQYRTGAEGIESIVVSAATVTAGADGRKIVEAGSLLTRITASKKFGPFASGATDGRQTLAAPTNLGVTAVFLTDDLDVTDGDKPLGGYATNCWFNNADLNLNGATQAAVRAAFPTCTGL